MRGARSIIRPTGRLERAPPKVRGGSGASDGCQISRDLALKLIKIGARVVRHARAMTFQLAEVAVTGRMVRAILAAIRRLRAPPQCA